MNLRKIVSNFEFKNWLKNNSQALFILFLLVFISYVNSIGNQFVSDDILGILKNKKLDDWGRLFSNARIVFLRHFFYRLIILFFGRRPAFFRLLNIFFHLGSVFCFYLLFTLLIGAETAFLGAVLLAVHPIETETVTWISGGIYVQYSFFIIISLIFFVLKTKTQKYYFYSILFYLLALFSSEKAVAFPLIIFSFMLAFFNPKKEWKKIIPYFILSGIWISIYISKISARLEKLHPVEVAGRQEVNFLLKIPIAIVSYLKLIFWPQGLTLYHSELRFHPKIFYIYLFFFLLFTASIIFFYFKDKKIFFGLSLLPLSLAPTLTPFAVAWVVAERYVYLGAMGIFLVTAIAVKKLAENQALKKAVYILFGLIVLSLSMRTMFRNKDWHNQDSLWISAARNSPNSPQNNNNLGDLYARRGDFEKAVFHFQKAIKLRPGYAAAYHNLANVFLQMEEFDKAEENFKKALDFNPQLWQSYQALGVIYQHLGEKEKAKEYLEKAKELKNS